MIDLKRARAEADAYRQALARKGAAEQFDELLAVDVHKRELQTQVEELRARTKLKGKPTPEQLAQVTEVKERLKPLEAELAGAEARLRDLHDRVPNPPAEDTPEALKSVALSDEEKGEGAAGKLLHDDKLYNNLNQTSAELVKMLYDFRQNPKKYLSIKVSLF